MENVNNPLMSSSQSRKMSILFKNSQLIKFNLQKRRRSRIPFLLGASGLFTSSNPINENCNNMPSLKGISFKYIIKLLRKKKEDRTVEEIKVAAHFLAMKNDFFKSLKSTDVEKLYCLVNVLNIETFKAGENLITCGEEGDKFYILLSGNAEIFIPKFNKKEMRLKDFIKYLVSVKNTFKGQYSLERIESENMKVYNISSIKYSFYNYKALPDYKRKYNFYVEEMIKVSQVSQGAAFGEVALIKKEKRNATIKAIDDVCVASIDKEDYNGIINEFEKKKFFGNIDIMKQNFLILKNWTSHNISRLINQCTTLNLISGDTLYKQCDFADSIFFSVSGSFKISLEISLATLENYKKYVTLSKGNIIDWINTYDNTKIIEIKEIEKYIREGEKILGEYPVKKVETHNKIYDDVSFYEDELIEFKMKEAIISNPNKIFNITLRQVSGYECFGVEDAFELKKRLYTVTCASINAEVKKISLSEMVSLICKGMNVSTEEIRTVIKEKKNFLLTQLEGFINEKRRHIRRDVKMAYMSVTPEKSENINNSHILPFHTQQNNFDSKQLNRIICHNSACASCSKLKISKVPKMKKKPVSSLKRKKCFLSNSASRILKEKNNLSMSFVHDSSKKKIHIERKRNQKILLFKERLLKEGMKVVETEVNKIPGVFKTYKRNKNIDMSSYITYIRPLMSENYRKVEKNRSVNKNFRPFQIVDIRLKSRGNLLRKRKASMVEKEYSSFRM